MIEYFSYKNEKDKLLSPHFKVKEFCDEKKDIKLDLDLIFYLECIFVRSNASKIIVTSGYRSKDEDKRVGGNGSGYHTKGQAVDFKVYDNNNKLIESKYIVCICQELGLKGIAIINDTCTHIDTRLSHYFGDERKTLSNVTDNFYDYCNVSFEELLNRVK